MALGMALEFYIILEKELKLKVRKIWVESPTFAKVTGEKQVGGGEREPFCLPSWIGLTLKF